MSVRWVSDVYNLPSHLRIHQWPKEIINAEVSNEFCSVGYGYNNRFVRILDQNESWCKFEVCDMADFYGDVDYPKDIIVMATSSLPILSWNKLKYYISDQYRRDKELAKETEYEIKYRGFIKKYIDDDVLETFLKGLIKDYINDLFKDHAEVLDQTKLLNQSKDYFLRAIYSYHCMISEDSKDNNDIDFEDEKWEVLRMNLQCTLFYDYFPILKKFSGMVSGLSKGEYPNGDCLCGSDVEELNMKYGLKLCEFAITLVLKV